MLMARFFPGRSECALCGQIITRSDEFLSFPAFLPDDHVWWRYSDAHFHSKCFPKWEDSEGFLELYARFREIWKSAPDSPFEAREKWLLCGTEEFQAICRDFPARGNVALE
jgi:hypothetical protein